MYRIVVILSLLSRVTSGIKIQRHVNSQNILRMSRSASVPSENGYVFNQFGDNSGMYAMFASEGTKHNPYTGLEPFDIKSAHKLGADAPYPDLPSVPDIVADRIPSHTMSPVKYNSDYEISRSKSDAKYASMTNEHAPSKIKSDIMIEKLKSMMHYAPPGHVMNDAFSSYETHSDYHNDDDDVRSSGRTMYDSYWPRIYHSPYEYEYKKEISELEKAKDKRYVSEALEVKPVHEHIENDVPNINTYDHDHSYERSTDNPIGGNGPFFSFVLNDYYDRNHEEDPLSFKGLDLDWGKEFDHDSYKPSMDDIIMNSRRDRRIKNSYYTTPANQWPTTVRPQTIRLELNDADSFKDIYIPIEGEIRSSNKITPFTSTQRYSPLQTYQPSYYDTSPTSNYYSAERNLRTDEGLKKDHDSDKHESGGNKYSNHRKEYGADGHKYEGFRDFLDSFANKFGSEDHKADFNYSKENNENKGEKKKGFHRIYHKDEFLEDKEFFDDSNNMSKAQGNGSSKVHVGGSEALLRSQALASTGNAANATTQFGNVGDENFENAHKLHGGFNTKGNKFVKLIDVAKQAAKSNSADYLDNIRA